VSGAPRTSTGRTTAWPAATLAACLLGVLLLVAWPSGASGQRAGIAVLGSIGAAPPPACPGSPCEAIGSVTGFQTTAGGVSQPFKAPFNGKVVAWSISLSRPDRDQREFFNDFYAPPPQARIAVLRRVRGSRPPEFTMVRQSPVVVLRPYLGSTVVFALEHPLTVLKDQVVAISIPTWAPGFAVGISANNTWRASRRSGACAGTRDIRASRAHQRVGSKRQYACSYTTARLLYTATVVRGRVSSGR